MDLVNELIKNKYIKNPDIIRAFKKIKREDFLLDEYKNMAEQDIPLPIGYGQTISQPSTVVFMLEALNPHKNDKILDVGSGSGWTCALLAEIVGKSGKVYGIERIQELKDFAENNINKYNFINKGIVEIFCSDGYEGLSDFAPFDKIIIAASAEEIPKKLLEQLKKNGRLVAPIGEQYELQDIVVIDKLSENKFRKQIFPGFAFVPLVK